MVNLKGISVLFIVLALTGCATIEGDWGKAQSSNTVGAYQEFLTKHQQSEFSEEARNRILAKLVLAMAPPAKLKLGIGELTDPSDWNPERLQMLSMPKLKKLLQEGADPNALRIKGYLPISTFRDNERWGHTITQMSGLPGSIVDPKEGGQTLLSFCREYGLLKAAELLSQHGAI